MEGCGGCERWRNASKQGYMMPEDSFPRACHTAFEVYLLNVVAYASLRREDERYLVKILLKALRYPGTRHCG